MSTKVPELSFKDIEKGDSFSINILKEALAAHGFFQLLIMVFLKILLINVIDAPKISLI